MAKAKDQAPPLPIPKGINLLLALVLLPALGYVVYYVYELALVKHVEASENEVTVALLAATIGILVTAKVFQLDGKKNADGSTWL